MELILKACDFAAKKHKGQKRKDIYETPYINHPIEVANLLTSCGITDTDTLIAALLHDTVEDTDTKIEEIVNLFGENVGKIVQECSDDKTLPKKMRKQLQIEHASKISIAARLVKLADKYSNLHDLHDNPPKTWNLEQMNGYAVWSYAVYLKLKGCNELLESKLLDLFSTFGINSLNEDELEKQLQKYYENMKS
jgi:guanosine-3',5'-bis(diphosphate) 3'-pyrophosphohydrolase